MDKQNEVQAMRAHEAKSVAESVQGGAIDYESVRRDACERIANAVADGELEIEIEVAPGMDWKLADDLSRFDYDVRRIRRGVLSVSWA